MVDVIINKELCQLAPLSTWGNDRLPENPLYYPERGGRDECALDEPDKVIL
jgi:hypothetical protein